MAIERVKEGKLLYHLTRLSNLDSIIEHGLVSRKLVKDNGVRFSDIANEKGLDWMDLPRSTFIHTPHLMSLSKTHT